MRTTRSNSQAGFIPIGYVLLAVIVVVAIGIGVFVAHHNKKTSDGLGPATAITPVASPGDKLHNFYDCFETEGRTYTSGQPNKCTAYGKTFSEPTSFTNDDVRAADTLPAGVRGQVFSDAATNFSKCGVQSFQDESLVPVTQVLSVLGSDWVYIGVSCNASTTEIFKRQPDASWLMVSKDTSKIACATVDKFQIPKELYLRSSNETDHDTACIKPDGTTQPIPYTYQPSTLTPEGGVNNGNNN